VLLDSLSHACMFAGARLSGAEVAVFRHNDLDDLAAKLAAKRAGAGRAMILTERVFSMDGDRAPVAALNALAAQYDAWLLVDDAHGLGVVEPDAYAPLEMGTMSKALASYGGYLCASAPVIDLLKTRARTVVYSTAAPPASIAGAIAALDIIESEPELIVRPLARARAFTAALNLPAAQSPIVPVVIGQAADALAASQALLEKGFLVVAIRPPTVPEGTARLRIAFSAGHSEEDVARLADAVRPLIRA
jgi:8-amino-7-oxononanoate synthase